MIEYDVRTRLLAVAGVTNIIGTGATNPRIAIEQMPQGVVYPCVTITRISLVPEYDMEGEAGVSEARIQIDVWDVKRRGVSGYDAYDQAQTLANAIQTAMSGLTGTWGSSAVQSCFLVSRRASRDDGAQTFRESMDFMLGYA